MIDKNVIYKEAYEILEDITEWGMDDISGREVSEYISGVTTLASTLLEKLDKKDNVKEDEK